MSRVLVTGGSGFIGQRLAAALISRGDEVRCLVRGNSQAQPLEEVGARLIRGDVTDPNTLPVAIDGVDTVYHLAARTRANTFAQYRWVNEGGVRNVVEACARRTSPPTVLIVSSLAATGPSPEAHRPRSECDPPQPVSNYGRSKRAGEMAAEARAADVPITIIRPPVVLGPGDRTGLALFQSTRRFRSFLVFGQRRLVSVIHVSDLTAAIIAAAERGQRLPTRVSSKATDNNGEFESDNFDNLGRGYYFVAADEQPSFAQLGRLIGRAVRRPRAWAIRIPTAVLWTVCGTGQLVGRVTLRPRYLNLDRAREMTAGNWTCSPEKARRELDFACKTPLGQRIQEIAQWYREQGWISFPMHDGQMK